MSLWRQLVRGVAALTNRTSSDREIADEVRHYYEETVAAHVARGLSPEDAARAARIELGNPTAVAEQVRDYGWENQLATSLSDLRYSARVLRRTPAFAMVVILVVSLGSGAVATVFSALNALVLRSIAGVRDADRLLTLSPIRSDGLILQQGSFADYSYLRSRAETLSDVAAWGKVSLTIAGAGEGTIVWGNMVSANYFDALHVHPHLGRYFSLDEDRTPLAEPVIVVSHAFWSTRLGRDPDIVGKAILVNGHPFTLIGIAPRDFHGIYTGVRADAWVPLMMQPLLRPRADLARSSWLWMFGRLKDRVPIESAQAELAALMTTHARESGEPKGPAGFRSIRASHFTGLPGGEGVVVVRFLGVLLAAAAMVLLIAGVNVAAMLTARSIGRARELAMRAALGAGRIRLARQVLTEILLLFFCGAVGGWILSLLATNALEHVSLPANLPILIELSPDVRVLVFAIGSALAVGVIFGLIPAVRAARLDITAPLRDSAGDRRWRPSLVNRMLIVGQLSLSLVLLVSAGLFTRSLVRGQQIDPGFQMAGVVTTSFETESWGYNQTRAQAFYATLRSRIQSMPGVVDVAYVSRLPLTGGSTTEDIEIDGATIGVQVAAVDAGYFSTLRMPIVQGRAFYQVDDERSERVAIVNESLARRLASDRKVVGRIFRFLGKPTTIVGVVGDAKYATLGESTPLFAYFPIAQKWQPTQALLVRTNRDAEWIGPAIEHVVLALDPAVPRPHVSSMKEATSIVLLPQRVAALVTGVLGAVGLLLAAVGLYGMMTYSVQRRRREMGIRFALGAQRSTVLGMVAREGVTLAILAIVIGVLLAAAAAQAIRGFLFDVSPFDGATFAGMSLVFLAIALVASYLPARRAAVSDPIAALRAD
jgi:predicted permease